MKKSAPKLDKEVKRTIDLMDSYIRSNLSNDERKYIAIKIANWTDELHNKRQKAYEGKGLEGQLERASEEVDSWPKIMKDKIGTVQNHEPYFPNYNEM